MNIGGYFHACTSLLDKLDHAQNRFLCELGLSTAEAFLEFNFAPPKLRRNVAVLGLLHKRVIGKCHPVYERLFPWYSQRFPEGRGFGHNKQLYNHCVEIYAHHQLYNRSFFLWPIFITIFRNMWSMLSAWLLFKATSRILHAHAVNNKMFGRLVLIDATTVIFDHLFLFQCRFLSVSLFLNSSV